MSALVPESGDAPSPSSGSTTIAVGMSSEEELYASVGGMDGLLRRRAERPSSPGSANGDQPTSGQSSDSHISTRDNLSHAASFSFDSDMSKYPASMTSSVRAHVYEGGLRYHAFRDGRYAFPNDEVEQNRDDMKHSMCLMLSRGKHFYSPIENRLGTGGQVLDLGTYLFLFVFLFLARFACVLPSMLLDRIFLFQTTPPLASPTATQAAAQRIGTLQCRRRGVGTGACVAAAGSSRTRLE